MPHTCTLYFSKVIHYLDDECFSFVHTLTNPSFVGVGELSGLWDHLLYTGLPEAPSIVLEESTPRFKIRISHIVVWSPKNEMEGF